MEHVTKEPRKLRKKNPRYESSWYGPINTRLNSVYRPESPNRLAVRPQETLRPPLETQDQMGGGIYSLISADYLDYPGGTSDGDLDSNSDDDKGPLMSLDDYLTMYEEDEPQAAPDEEWQSLGAFDQELEESQELELQDEYIPEDDRFSICSLGYAVQATGKGPEKGKSVPDFVIDQQSQTGERRILSIVEIKRTTWVSDEDINRFNKYGLLIRKLNDKGIMDTTNVVMMLILGAYAYSWDFEEWPSSGIDELTLQRRARIPVDKKAFLDELERIRDRAPFGWYPPAPAG